MSITKYIFKMANVQRFSGKKLDCPYSIGEHSYRVACLVLMIIDQYNLENPDNKISPEIGMRKSLLHDLEETITGDIPSPVKKYGNLRDELRSASEKIMENILKGSPLPKLYKKYWVEDKENEAGDVIVVADKLEGLLVCFYENKRGNKYIEEAFVSHLDWFESDVGQSLLKKFSFARNEYEKVLNYLGDPKPSSLEFFKWKKFKKN